MSKILLLFDREFLYGFATGVALGIVMKMLRDVIRWWKKLALKGEISPKLTNEALVKIKTIQKVIPLCKRRKIPRNERIQSIQYLHPTTEKAFNI
jgi:hypothetical protein